MNNLMCVPNIKHSKRDFKLVDEGGSVPKGWE